MSEPSSNGAQSVKLPEGVSIADKKNELPDHQDWWEPAFGDKDAFDKGIFSIYFLNIVHTSKGDAIFQDNGILHAYLQGQNIELMANSDNVLRAGLTPKHVDVPELLKHVVFEETKPGLMSGELQKDGIETIYKSPAPDFELSRIELQKTQKYLAKAKTVQILMIIEGEAMIHEGKTSLKCKKGDSVLLTAEADYSISTKSKVVIYKATVGQ